MQKDNAQKALVAKEGLKHFEIAASKESDELIKNTLRRLDFNND